MSLSTTSEVNTDTLLSQAAEALAVSEKEVLRQGIYALLERQLRDLKMQIFELTGRYAVASVEDMEARYQEGTLEEAGSWRDMQRLDHLEYKRDRLQRLGELHQ